VAFRLGFDCEDIDLTEEMDGLGAAAMSIGWEESCKLFR
jgi:hypothetical protein